MKKILTPFLLVIISVFAHTFNARAQFIISGEFRPRIEYRDGYMRLRDSSQIPYPTILGRNRIAFDYKNERFQARFSVQHAYVFGENNYSSDTITRNTINIYEGYFRYGFSKNFAIKIGRTELFYDDGRLLGNSNWSPKGATHDVAILQWELPGSSYRGDLGFAINNTAPASTFLASYPLKNYKYMAYLYEQRKFFKDKLTISMLAILDVYQKTSTQVKKTSTKFDTLWVIGINHDTIGSTILPTTTSTIVTTAYPDQLYGRFTIGGTVSYTVNKLKLFGSGYWQTGRFMNGKKINAGMVGIWASYKVLKSLNLQLGYDLLSGNDYTDTAGFVSKSTAFSTLYPTSHGFYGYMDMFSAITPSGISAGLNQVYLKATVNLGEKAYLEGAYRWFALAQGALQTTVNRPGDLPYITVSKPLGSEFDLMAVYKPHPNIEINAAYCFFLPTTTMERLDGLKPGTSRFAQYAYIMITYKPTFFNSDKH